MRVGLTGGVASGKSTVSAMLRELGAVVIDADALAREVVEPGTPGLAAVVAEFGPEVLGRGRRLDRASWARSCSPTAARRAALEAIVHPLVRAGPPSSRRPRRPGARRRPRHPAARRDRPGRRLRRGHRGRRTRPRSRSSGWCATAAGPRRTPGPDRGPGRRGRSGWRPRRTSSTTPGRSKTSASVWRRSSAELDGPGVTVRLERRRRQAARSGSPRRRSFCSASRSSWRTRSAEMPCRAPMSASLCWRPSSRP